MKVQRKLNIVLIVLIIILISIISFVGIYRLEKNEMVNILPSYILGTDISGYRKVSLELLENETEITEESETLSLGEYSVENTFLNETESSDVNETEENVNSETQQNEISEVQSENTVNKENLERYLKSAKIIKARLKSLNVEDYRISVNGVTGKIDIDLPENDATDSILSDLTQVGKFEITDSNTGEVLLGNDDVRSATVKEQNNYGYTFVTLNIKFTAKGSRIFKGITSDYNENAVIEKAAEATDEAEDTVDGSETENSETNTEENTDTENVDENNTEVNDEGNNDAEETSDGEETSDDEEVETVEKTVDLKIDDSTLLSTRFPEVVENGELVLNLGTSTDVDEINSYKNGGMNVAAIIENEPLPDSYQITENIYVASTITNNEIKVTICVIAGLMLLLSIAMIVKFKMKGFMASILSVGFIATLLIAIRFTNVTMCLEGIFAIGLAFIINTIFNYILLKNLKGNLSKEERIEKYFDAMKKYSLITIPLLILSVVCCFIKWDTIYSFGMVTFWTVILSLLYNLTITNLVVRNK